MISREEHARRATEYEVTAAFITVRNLHHVQDPEPFWTLAAVHRAWLRKIDAA